MPKWKPGFRTEEQNGGECITCTTMIYIILLNIQTSLALTPSMIIYGCPTISNVCYLSVSNHHPSLYSNLLDSNSLKNQLWLSYYIQCLLPVCFQFLTIIPPYIQTSFALTPSKINYTCPTIPSVTFQYLTIIPPYIQTSLTVTPSNINYSCPTISYVWYLSAFST